MPIMFGEGSVPCRVVDAVAALKDACAGLDAPNLTFVYVNITVDVEEGEPDHAPPLSEVQHGEATLGELVGAITEAGEGNVFWSTANPAWNGDRCVIWRVGLPHDRHMFACPSVHVTLDPETESE